MNKRQRKKANRIWCFDGDDLSGGQYPRATRGKVLCRKRIDCHAKLAGLNGGTCGVGSYSRRWEPMFCRRAP